MRVATDRRPSPSGPKNTVAATCGASRSTRPRALAASMPETNGSAARMDPASRPPSGSQRANTKFEVTRMVRRTTSSPISDQTPAPISASPMAAASPVSAATMLTLDRRRNCWRRRRRLSGTMPSAVISIRPHAAAITGIASAYPRVPDTDAATGSVTAAQASARPVLAQKAELRSAREISAFCSTGLDRTPPVSTSPAAIAISAMPYSP